ISRWVMKGWSAENSPRAMVASSSPLTQAKSVVPGGGRPSGAVTWSSPVGAGRAYDRDPAAGLDALKGESYRRPHTDAADSLRRSPGLDGEGHARRSGSGGAADRAHPARAAAPRGARPDR